MSVFLRPNYGRNISYREGWGICISNWDVCTAQEAFRAGRTEKKWLLSELVEVKHPDAFSAGRSENLSACICASYLLVVRDDLDWGRGGGGAESAFQRHIPVPF